MRTCQTTGEKIRGGGGRGDVASVTSVWGGYIYTSGKTGHFTSAHPEKNSGKIREERKGEGEGMANLPNRAFCSKGKSFREPEIGEKRTIWEGALQREVSTG